MRVVFPSSGNKASPPFQLGSVIHTTRGAWRISIGLLCWISHSAAETAASPSPSPQRQRTRRRSCFPCHVQSDMYAWFHAVTAEGNGAVVIKFLQTHRRWYIEGCRVERRPSYAAANPRDSGFFFYHQRKGSVVRCRLFHVNHNNGVSVIISPQADLPPSLPSAFPSAASQGLNFPVMRTT